MLVRKNNPHSVKWQIWRNILDRITSNRHYRWEDPQKYVLLNMAKFASSEMAHYNTLTYYNREQAIQEWKNEKLARRFRWMRDHEKLHPATSFADFKNSFALESESEMERARR